MGLPRPTQSDPAEALTAVLGASQQQASHLQQEDLKNFMEEAGEGPHSAAHVKLKLGMQAFPVGWIIVGDLSGAMWRPAMHITKGSRTK